MEPSYSSYLYYFLSRTGLSPHFNFSYLAFRHQWLICQCSTSPRMDNELHSAQSHDLCSGTQQLPSQLTFCHVYGRSKTNLFNWFFRTNLFKLIQFCDLVGLSFFCRDDSSAQKLGAAHRNKCKIVEVGKEMAEIKKKLLESTEAKNNAFTEVNSFKAALKREKKCLVE